MNDVNLGRIDAMILLADEAERQIAMSMVKQTSSMAPSIDRTAGEIDLAYKLKLIDYPRRDFLMGQLSEIVAYRRKQLNKQRTEKILAATGGVKHWWPEQAAKAADRGES